MATHARDDSTLRIFAFHGTGRDDGEKHQFICDAIWSVKQVRDEATNIAELETTFRDKDLTCYIKYKFNVPARRAR
jgi:hypothetical protein